MDTNMEIEYTPQPRPHTARLIDVNSAWKGLEDLIPDIIQRFGISNGTALEFGVEYGYSTAALANYFNKVVGVDNFTGDAMTVHDGSFFEEAKNNLKDFPNIDLFQGDFRDFIAGVDPDAMFDLIHVDISHDYESTYELGLWATKHSKVTIFHDTESFHWSVKKAVEDIAKESGKAFYNYKAWNGLGILV